MPAETITNQEAIEMMNRCKAEIVGLRATIDRLQPKADAYDNMAIVLHLLPLMAHMRRWKRLDGKKAEFVITYQGQAGEEPDPNMGRNPPRRRSPDVHHAAHPAAHQGHQHDAAAQRPVGGREGPRDVAGHADGGLRPSSSGLAEGRFGDPLDYRRVTHSTRNPYEMRITCSRVCNG